MLIIVVMNRLLVTKKMYFVKCQKVRYWQSSNICIFGTFHQIMNFVLHDSHVTLDTESSIDRSAPLYIYIYICVCACVRAYVRTYVHTYVCNFHVCCFG